MHIEERQVDGLSISLARAPRPDVPTLVVTSGWPQTLLALEEVWSAWRPHFDLLAFDPPGFGRSEGRPDLMSPSAQAGFLVRMLDAFGLERVHLVALDVGVPLALRVAQKSPGRLHSLSVADGACVYPPHVCPELWGLVHSDAVRRLTALSPRLFLEYTRLRGYRRTKPSPRVWRDAFAVYDRQRVRDTLRYLESYPRELPAIERELPTVRTPTLVLWAEKDAFLYPENARRLHASLPFSRLEILSGAGHFSHEEAPDAFAAHVASWIDGVEGTGIPARRGSARGV